ncbi:MAG: N-acetylmuramoyl-L-alanine amidase [Chitinophagaceae bacterium]
MLKFKYKTLSIFTIIFIFSCSKSTVSKYQSTNKQYKKQAKDFGKKISVYPLQDSVGLNYANEFVGTTNFSLRKPNFVIIHHTAQNSCEQTLKTFTLPRTQVSAHYVICKDGTVHHMLNDYLRAHHAGIAKWGNSTDINSNSIGIELDNNGFENFDEPQINSLLALLDRLKKQHAIPTANFIGHGDIAPTRKNDPNWRFPWKTLSDKGFGLWFADTTNTILPNDFSNIVALRIIGYDVKDTTAAKIGFKRHWLQDTTKTFTNQHQKILYELMKKFM